MAKGFTKRVVLNRSAIHEVTLAMADGMFAVTKEMIETADPPDTGEGYYYFGKKGARERGPEREIGEGLVKGGGVLAYVDGKKVNGWHMDGRQPKPPRAAKVSKGRGAVVIFGFRFPGRFQEFGTIHHAPQPFLTPAVDATMPRSTSIMAPVVGPKLPRP